MTPSLGAFERREELRTGTASGLVVLGSSDVTPADSSRAWAAAPPNAGRALLGGMDHFQHLEAPEQFLPMVNACLAGG
jgi:pimeloyl-ACP methyl ester carboxylesterase